MKRIVMNDNKETEELNLTSDKQESNEKAHAL